MCPSPFNYLSYEERLHTLAISFSDSHKPAESINTISEFIYQLYYSLDYLPSVQLKARWQHNTIVINCGKVNMVDFEAGADAKQQIIEAGRRAAEGFLKSPGYKPVRRFSVA